MRLFRWLFGKRIEQAAPPLVISRQHLPAEFHFIIPLAERHGSQSRVKEFDHKLGRHVAHAEKIGPEEIEQLRTLYCEIRERNQCEPINRWLHEQSKKKEKTCPTETTWLVYGLLCLFDQLGELGIDPFTDGTVRPMEFRPELDWSKLPPALRDLAGSAEVFGEYQFDDRIWEFLETMTEEERVELRALNERMSRDWDALERWLNDYRITEHREAALIYFTMHLITMAIHGDYLSA